MQNTKTEIKETEGKIQKRCRKDFKTNNKNIKAHATWPNKTHDFDVTVYLVDANTAIQLDFPKPMKKRVHRIEDFNIVISHVIQALMDELKKTEPEEGSTAMEDAFEKVRARQEELLGWTNDQYLTFFERNVLPAVKDCVASDDFSKDDLERLKKELLTSKKKNSKEENKEIITMSDIVDRLKQATTIYEAMREVNPELPILRLNDYSEVGRRDQKEQVKSLPYEVHKKFRKLVEANIINAPKYARAAALMDSGGLRSGEASAVTISKVKDYGTYSIVWVLQQESEGIISNVTKSINGYRMVLLDEWGTKVVRKCNELIGEEDEIDRAPLLDKELSAEVRKLLEAAGCKKEIFEAAEAEMAEMKNKSMDISAHILRRNRASIWRNICGFIQWEIDYLLGHRNDKDKFEKGNPKDEKTINRWVKMMNRYDTEARNGEDPEEDLIYIEKPTTGTIIPFAKIKFCNSGNSPLKLRYKVETAEMNDSIRLIMGEDYVSNIKSDSGMVKNRRKNVNLIGRILYE